MKIVEQLTDLFIFIEADGALEGVILRTALVEDMTAAKHADCLWIPPGLEASLAEITLLPLICHATGL